MEKQIVDKTSFSEICKILKDNKYDICECINGVFEVALLFFPCMVCKDIAFITNIVNGATILGAKPIIEKSIKNIAKVFTKKKFTDFTTKYDYAQIAQVLIVFAAYFDSIKLYLPDEERKIKISSKEKQLLTESSISQYANFIEENLSKNAEQTAKDIFEYDLSIPDPVENLKDYLEQLQKFYEILNKEFLQFYEKLSFFDAMNEEKREHFLTIIRGLPAKAVENYKKQYYQLAINFNDFFVWTNIEEHKRIQKKLDVGFSEIARLVSDYCEKSSNSKARNTLEQYRKKYNSYVDTPVVDVSEMNFCSTDEIIFPNKRHIFVPQSFKALTYKNDIHLENRDTWKMCDERDDIGKFVSDILRHSVTGSLPLLILGNPGAGKSLLCNMLAAQILHHEYHVIIIKLRDTVAEQTIPQQINQQIERDFSNGCLWSDIAESGLDKPILIIFDGYDELLQASGRSYSDYLQRIAEFQKQQKDIYGIFVKCIVTSRITLIDKALISNNSPVIMLSDFDEKRINQWCKIWNEKNEDYFLQSNLEKFEVDSSSKVSELAKQPLLLLMLALYDSNDNALKRNKDLNGTQLYDNLIREFISREKRKDDGFRSLQVKEQERIINEEMIKISIAALGMYNRKMLYIRSNELEKDLQFILQENNIYDVLKNNELSESDKLLGSFFFIHKSNSTDVIDREKIPNAAYEFLHNTFGEFLTANYIVTEMKNVLCWIHTLVETNRKSQWKLCSQRAWVICMAYAPLFSRPVVVQMIHEWALGFFEDKNIAVFNEDLDNLLEIEIKNVVSGNIIFDLKEVMEEKSNPYYHDDLLKHLAIYSLNLIIIRTIVFDTKYEFKFSNEIWNKLLYIWKYAFSEDELLNFANQFTTNRVGDIYKVSCEKEGRNVLQSQMSKYLRIDSAVGDSVSYGIVGSLIGENEPDKVMYAIDNNQLNIRARYLWNYCLNVLAYYKYNKSKIIDIICEINEFSWKEQDVEYILCSYILIDDLLKNRIVTINQHSNYKIIKIIMNLVENIEHINWDFRNEIPVLIFDIASNILDYVKLDDEDIEKIWRCHKWGHPIFFEFDFYYALNFVNKILKKVVMHGKSRRLRDLSEIRYIEECMERMMYTIRKKHNVSSTKLLEDLLEFVDNYVILIDYIDSKRVEDIYFTILEEVIYQYSMKNKFSFQQKMLIIKSIYIMFERGISYREDLVKIFIEVAYPIDVKQLYDKEQEIFYNFLVLINNHIFICEDNIEKDIIWIVEHRDEKLSLRSYKQIKIFAQNINCDRLLDSLEQLLI